MDENDILNQIPLDWYEQLEQKEIEVEQERAFHFSVRSLIKTIGITKENPSIETILKTGAEFFKITEQEVHDNLIDLAQNSANIQLFNKYYGHLLPKDETGNVLFSPKIMAIVSGRPEEDILREIEKNQGALENVAYWPEEPTSSMNN